MLMYLWSMRQLRTSATRMLGMSKNSVGNFYAVLRHLCGRDLADRPIIPFGGNACIVKCDETKFNHKSKVARCTIFAVINCPSDGKGRVIK